ncbi:MAG: hypothetical protein Q8R26_01045, partial [bacterium]|nr:hypothetical protein [bacterium]
AMTADTYGGKSPQETLDMFIAALEKGDIELASKYFLLDMNENYSRGKQMNYLENIKNKNLLISMIQDLKTAESHDSLYEGNQQFIIYNKEKTDSLLINFRFNEQSNIWKIESF